MRQAKAAAPKRGQITRPIHASIQRKSSMTLSKRHNSIAQIAAISPGLEIVRDEKLKTNSRRRLRLVRDETDLVRRLQAKDPVAFREFYETNRMTVERFIRSRVPNYADYDDLAQETFVQAFRSIGSFRGGSSLSTWLIGIARHVCSHFFRTSDRWMVNTHPMSSAPCEKPHDARLEACVEARRLLKRCGRSIERTRSAEAQKIFLSRYIDGKSIREISVEASKSNDAVKMSLRRSREAIKHDVMEVDAQR